MSFLSEKTTKSSHFNAEPETGQGEASELSSQNAGSISPHLEDILGRINSIMSDASGARSPQPRSFSSAYQDELLNHDLQGQDRGFVATEPTDMLKPYSETLGEVRDYFKDRHSLDKTDSLMNSQPKTSLTDDMRRLTGTRADSSYNAPPKSVHQWGEEVELKFQEAVRLEDEAPVLAEAPRDVFSPMKFSNPFDRQPQRDQSSMEVLAPETEDFKRLRHDLVDRIAQLEQVIGHHFGDQKQVATEAAQAAIRMTLQNLDDTTLGKRLTDIETAFMLFQKNQDQRNLETKLTLMKMGAQLNQVTDGVAGEASVAVPSLESEGAKAQPAVQQPVMPAPVAEPAPVMAKAESAAPNLILTPVLSSGGVNAGAVKAGAGEQALPDQSGVKLSVSPVAEATAPSELAALGGATPPQMPVVPQAPRVPLAEANTDLKTPLGKVATESQVATESKVRRRVLEEQPAKELESQDKATVAGSPLDEGKISQGAVSAGVGEFSQPLDYMIGDIQVPGGANAQKAGAVAGPEMPPALLEEDDGFPQVITGPVESGAAESSADAKSVQNAAGLNDGQTKDGTGDAGDGSNGSADEVGSIEQMRELLKGSEASRKFGKNEKSRDAMGKLVAAAEASRVEGDEDLDDYLQKSAALRAQFKQAKIVSNDDDLHSMERKGSRIAIGIIVFTLVLAAIGVAMQNDTKSLQNLIDNVVTKVKDFTGGLKLPDRLENKPSVQGNVSDDKSSKNSAELNNVSGEADMTVTGNINGGEQKSPALKGTSEKSNGDTETALGAVVLPAVEGNEPGLPPALIGPYSLRHAASKGDVAAQYEVARRFGLGQGVPRDHSQAVKWYMLAAAQGFAPAQYRLATYYERGRGVEKNLERAKVWYQRAAELGNVKAMHNLAVVSTALTQGDGDYKKAIYWFKEAGNRNLADSQFNLAILYQNGVGLKKDVVQSYVWFSLAARQGDADAASRRNGLEKTLSKKQIFEASKILQNWKPLDIKLSANKVGGISTHMTSTMSHADETISRSRVLTAQILLRKLGYGLDEADGALNDQTIMAIKKFEKDKGLPITGKVSRDLLKFLNKASL